MAVLVVTVFGIPQAQASLAKRRAPALNFTLAKSLRAAGNAVKPYIQAAAPVRTGATRASVSVRGSKNITVGPRIWYRHFPIVGTSRGVEKNPWVARGVRAGAGTARRVRDSVIKASL